VNEHTTHADSAGSGLAPPEQRSEMMLAHVLGLLFGVLGALIYWAINKDKQDIPFVQDQAQEVLNFTLNILVLMTVSCMLVVVLIGFVLAPLVWLAAVVFGIIGAVKAYGGETYRYPFIIRLIK